MRGLCDVTIEKILKDTGPAGRPFYTKVSEIKEVRLLGLLIYKTTTTGNFPDPAEK